MERHSVMPGLARIAQRRAVLREEIAQQRGSLVEAATLLRKEAAYAALGLAAGKLLGRWPWARTLAIGAATAFAFIRLRPKTPA
jgi:hypothetical protein